MCKTNRKFNFSGRVIDDWNTLLHDIITTANVLIILHVAIGMIGQSVSSLCNHGNTLSSYDW